MQKALPVLLLLATSLPLARSEAIQFNRDVRPILSENCFSCHGFDEKGRKAKLRLDVAASAYTERNGFTAIKPGDLANSEAWIRINSEEEDEQMPPHDSHLALSTAQKNTLRAWIEQGAPYTEHWSFVPPVRPTVPSDPSGASPVDAFVRARLSEEGLAPTAEADRRTLIRRITLDLTGLPPTSEEVESFVTDRDPLAYAKRVDRLLASPHYGERMAIDWLDAARYADTNGFSIDGGRHLWLWRDWVIQAFNDNKPYDRFLLEQIAGDLLPDHTDDELIATGFQRNNMVTHEGGTIPEENLLNYNADRVKTLGEAVVGLTLACAQCHDHKFDPITQADYFKTYAFFNSLPDKGLDGNAGVNPGPQMEARTVLRTGEESQLRSQITALQGRLQKADTAILRAWSKRERVTLDGRGRDLALHPLKVLKASTAGRSDITLESDNQLRLQRLGAAAAVDVLTRLPAITQPVTGFRLIVHPVSELPGGGWGRNVAGAAPKPATKDETAPPVNGEYRKGTFRLTALSLSADATPTDQVNLHRLSRFSRVSANSWDPAHAPAGCLDARNDSGWSPDLETQGKVHLTATLAEPLNPAETPFLTLQLNFGAGKDLVPERVELVAITGTDDGSDLPTKIVSLLQRPDHSHSPSERDQLWSYCADHAEELRPLRVDLANLEERLATLTQPFPTMVMKVAAQPRDTFILNRGDYAQPTVKVQPGTPGFLPPMPDGAPANRLGLAQWLTMKDHPLTARVAVNRLWRTFFDLGIVATAADFGAQGDWPSHPALLDWLAVEFVESGWNVKHLVRLIVLSETYRQSAVASPALLERDPQNRLLARGPRFRLQAELVRDVTLQVAGLLVPRVGGPSVNPYTPGDLWREVSHYGSTPATAQTFVQDHGEKLYRRSLYTYWKRTAPPPNMAAFDAPNREVCTVDRGRTTTPLQALVLLNDTQYVEASRAFAQRILQRRGNDTARLRWAFGECLSRPPNPKELQVLAAALRRERSRYAANPAAAQAFLAVGESPRDTRLPLSEHAAWSQVGALLLNLSETITRN